jgi:hypothetical protein
MTTEVITITVDPPIQIEIVGEDATAITVVEQGPQGPAGPAGTGSAFPFTQPTPSSAWTVNHNLGFFPTVTVYSVGSVEVEALVTHTSLNQTVISFSTPTAGTARCS